MSAFADTSIVCALTCLQDNTPYAKSLVSDFKEPIQLSALVVFEFRQSVRLQAFRFSRDRSQGFSKAVADAMLDQLDENIARGVFAVPSIDWMDVYSLAERLSIRHTFQQGHRTMDVLHVATALHLKTKVFLSFDQKQVLLAKKEGLKVPR
ncbi:MAG: type II toxin-antitoxin system VapC family toxin [Chthoniobacterales bacterium]|nr:type II toxin-antitoxin system VapC family toxin [Chthoniobacterales bacterium]